MAAAPGERGVYPAKYDAVRVAPYFALVALFVAIALVDLALGSAGIIIALPLVLALLVVLLRAFLWPVTYVLSRSSLEVRAGWFMRRSVAVGDILATEEVRDHFWISGAVWLAPYVWSRDYAEISYRSEGGVQFLLAAPRNLDSFLAEIEVLRRQAHPCFS